MSQLKLVQESVAKVKSPESLEPIQRIHSSKSMYERINQWVEQCKEKKENYAYISVEYNAEIFVNGFMKELLSTTSTMERPFRNDSEDSYAGSWGTNGTYNQNNLDELKKELLKWRKDFLEVSYFKEKADGTALRDIKAQNVRIFIDEKAKEFIAREAKWNLNELASELKALIEAPITEEYLKKFDRMEFLNKEIHKVEYELLPDLKDKAEKAFEEKTTVQTVIDGDEFDLNSAYRMFKRLKIKLAGMEKEYDELRHELYRW